MITDFEAIRTAVRSLPKSDRFQHLRFLPLGRKSSAGIAKNANGGYELFFLCPRIEPQNLKLQRCISFGNWSTETASSFEANRISLPSEPYFDSLVASIMSEYLRLEALVGHAKAFGSCEDLIALAFDKTAMQPQVPVGLAGELYLLHTLLSHSQESSSREIFGWWIGHGRTSRDFEIRDIGIEVKTTTGSTSTHSISSISQVEPGLSASLKESRLYLLSIGIVWLPPESDGGTSIRDLVNEILNLLDNDLRPTFQNQLRAYGGDLSRNFDSTAEQVDEIYERAFRINFTRMYDMGDKLIRVLKSADTESFGHVDSDSISYRIKLPSQVRGEINPVADLDEILEILLF